MPIGDGVRVVLYQSEIERIVKDEAVRQLLLAEGRDLADASARAAPKATGAGADSIRAETILDGDSWEARVAWDREHFYMYFHQKGTRYLPARPFMQSGGFGIPGI
jgi:HK97 gp10 family phage protein